MGSIDFPSFWLSIYKYTLVLGSSWCYGGICHFLIVLPTCIITILYLWIHAWKIINLTNRIDVETICLTYWQKSLCPFVFIKSVHDRENSTPRTLIHLPKIELRWNYHCLYRKLISPNLKSNLFKFLSTSNCRRCGSSIYK